MSKYVVVVEEIIRECRTYEVEATSARGAAEEASAAWISGIEPPSSKILEVTDRTYEVSTPAGDVECFGTEVEDGPEPDPD